MQCIDRARVDCERLIKIGQRSLRIARLPGEAAGNPAWVIGWLEAQPLFVVALLFAFGVVDPSLAIAVVLGGALLIGDVVGWWLIAPLFDRERLISGSH